MKSSEKVYLTWETDVNIGESGGYYLCHETLLEAAQQSDEVEVYEAELKLLGTYKTLPKLVKIKNKEK